MEPSQRLPMGFFYFDFNNIQIMHERIPLGIINTLPLGFHFH